MTDRLGVENPVLVVVKRGRLVDSVHRGAVALVSDTDSMAVGDIDNTIAPRCATKLIQALPLLTTGAADHFKLSSEELTLACSSQIGLATQVFGLRNWFERIGLSEDHISCPPSLPVDQKERARLIRIKEAPSAFYARNLGRHIALLTTSLFCGDPLEGYLQPDHPAQQRVRLALTAATGSVFTSDPDGFDDCGMPSHGLTLRALAEGMRRLGTGEHLDVVTAKAGFRILDSIAAAPELLVGPGRSSTDCAITSRGEVIVKGGAGGVYAGVHRNLGIGFALKICDGNQEAADRTLNEICSVFPEMLCSPPKSLSRENKFVWTGPSFRHPMIDV